MANTKANMKARASRGVEYKWAAHVPKGDAQVVGNRISALRAKNGKVVPADVVRDARRAESPLHNLFEWDDSKAAELYREDQARWVIRHLVLAKDETGQEVEGTVRAFLLINEDDDETRGYVDTAIALGNAESRQEILDRALRELMSWQGRYEHLKEFAVVCGAIRAEFPKLNRLVEGVPKPKPAPAVSASV
jgi:hypothetical protein